MQDSSTLATTGNAVAVGAVDYEHTLTTTTKVVDHFHVESGKDDTQLTNFLGLEVKMSTALALSVGLDVRDNTSPPAPKKKIDTVTTLNLVYAF
jgi:putative salt-induced outer membrane protein